MTRIKEGIRLLGGEAGFSSSAVSLITAMIQGNGIKTPRKLLILPAILIALLALVNTCTDRVSTWTYYSSKAGDLPPPNSGNQQTASLVLDIDKDGTLDFVIAERTKRPSVVWYKYSGGGIWSKHTLDDEALSIEAGDDYADIDEDGDLDIVFGGDSRSNQIWWWENPHPNYDPNTPWTRRLIKNSGSNKHHDQIFGDFDGDGRTELASWNQGARQLFLFEIPGDPKAAGEWSRTAIFTAPNNKYEGLAAADVDLDGKIDIIGAGRWFKHKGGMSYTANVIDSSAGSSRWRRCMRAWPSSSSRLSMPPSSRYSSPTGPALWS